MAISYVDSTVAKAQAVTTLQATSPTGTATDDLVVLAHHGSNQSSNTASWSATSYTGWTIAEDIVEASMVTRILFRVLDGSGNDAFPTVDSPLAVHRLVTAATYRGVNPTAPFIAESGIAHTAAASATTATPSANNTDAAAWAVVAAGARQVATTLNFTPPAGLTERQDDQLALGTTNNAAAGWFDSAGVIATGTTTYTITHQSTAQATVWQGILNPAAAAAKAPPVASPYRARLHLLVR